MDPELDIQCPFCCSIEQVFAESENFQALYNIAPILPGHSLIVPKRHAQSLLELTDEEVTEMVEFSRQCLRVLMQAFGTTAFNWTIQEGTAAGQTVPHLHLHLIPRKDKDLPNPGDWYPRLLKQQEGIIDSESRERLSSTEMKQIVSYLRNIAATFPKW